VHEGGHRVAREAVRARRRRPRDRRGGERGQALGRQLAGRVARQARDLDDAARQERRVDALAQRGDDRALAQLRCDDERDQAHDLASPARSGGIQNAPSTTPSIAFRW
jgi:hypothetical protein